MTAKLVYDYILIELNKVNAPSLLLEDFNYLFNKAINQYVNKRYNIYDVNQQTTDDLRVLKSTAVLKPIKVFKDSENDVTGMNSLYGATYEAYLPMDYLHILSCICNFKVNKNFKCYDKDSFVQFSAQRLTSDAWSTIINNFYMRPSYKRPYYYIHNVNTSYNTVNLTDSTADSVLNGDYSLPTNPITYNDEGQYIGGTDVTYRIQTKVAVLKNTPENTEGRPTIQDIDGNTYYLKINSDGGAETLEITVEIDSTGTSSANTAISKAVDKTFPKTITLGKIVESDDKTIQSRGSLIEKPEGIRASNTSPTRIEVRYGKDASLFELVSVYVDYIKSPLFIRLTLEQLDLTEDTSQIMEFPDVVCQEIINELVHIIMENSSDPRLQSHIPISLSIANPSLVQLAPQNQSKN